MWELKASRYNPPAPPKGVGIAIQVCMCVTGRVKEWYPLPPAYRHRYIKYLI